jgi:pyochelin synthetase
VSDVAADRDSLTPAEKRALLKRLLAERREGRTVERLPPLVAAPGERHEPFPLTDIQQAYWVGRGSNFALGQVSCHAYSEMDLVGIDLPRLNRAWQAMVSRHDMMRAIVRPDGQQVILETVPAYEIAVADMRGQAQAVVDAHVAAMRAELSHQVLPSDRWPLFDLRATLLDGGRTRLHTSLDLMIVDFWSIVMLVREWFEAYARPDAARTRPKISFRDYVLAERQVRETELYSRSLQYWRDRVSTLPAAPDLPLAKPGGLGSRPVFVRHGSRLEAPVWRRLKERASAAGLTSSSALLAAFGDVLAAWSKSPRYTLNLTLFYRLPFEPEVASLLGDFTSVSFLDVDTTPADDFTTRARRHQAQLWEHLEHRYISGIEVLRELARSSGGSQRALMPVVFTSLLGLTDSDKSAGGFSLPGDVVYAVSQTPQVWLDHQVYEQEGALVFSWDVREDLFPRGLIAEMFAAYCQLLANLATGDGAWLAIRPCGLPSAQAQAMRAFNDTAAPQPDARLHDVPAVPVRADDVAVVDARRSMTRGELDRAARRIARQLHAHGARPETLVAIVMEKGWEQVAAALGVLHSGAAYLPIDPHLPRERFQHLLERGEVRVAVTQPSLDGRLPWPAGVARVVVEEAMLEEAPGEALPADTPIPADALAYVIFTSGSTGEPKGVMIEHGAAVNTIADINRRFGVTAADRVLAVSSLGFDLSVYDVFGMWAAGGAIVVPQPEREGDPAHWAELLRSGRVTVWNSAPVLMKLLVEYLESRRERFPESLRLVMLSGDWIPVSLPDRIRALGAGIEVVSLGGATEASIWSIFYPVRTVDPEWNSIPYGRPLANQQFYVLNAALEPCPTWVTGELYIGGAGLARGYWRDETRTASSFIQHPTTGERLYRTGDLGRWTPDGVIEFLGREDNQVKVQGYRIELGEVEAAIRRHPAVRDVAVATRTDDRGERRLVAGVVVVTDQERPSPSSLREFIGGWLPAYMVPAEIAILDALPVTSNGKVDRKALGRLTSTTTAPVHAPAGGGDGALMAKIGALIAPMLGLDHIAPDEDLVNIGATSVDIVRIANLLEQELGERPNIAEFYQQPTIAGLSTFYSSGRGGSVEPGGGGESLGANPDTEMLLDPAAREAFKKTRPGLRHDAERFRTIPLPAPPAAQLSAASLGERRSERTFHSGGRIELESLSGLLGGLRGVQRAGTVKYAYGSAGGIYPVQAYVHVKEGRVEGLAQGLYYYHPMRHELVLLEAGLELDRSIHEPFVNRPIFDSAAFSIFFIARQGAIRPLYGSHATSFSTIEAGAMMQLLTMIAPGFGLGLCPIGDLTFDRIRAHFHLDESDVLVHSLLGGLPVPRARRRAELPRRGADVDARFGELRADAVLDTRIEPRSAVVDPDWTGGQQLITGVTGFIGAYLFEELLRKSSARFACLVRTADPEQGFIRIREVMKRYDLWDEAFAHRFVVVPGELSRPHFGLEPDHYDRLARSCESAIHLAAQVNFIYPYAALKAANVGGVHEMIRFCCTGPTKPLQYMSTAAVWPMGGTGRFGEDDDLDHGVRLDLGYYESKWVAEHLALEARRRGLPVSIYRPAEVSGHSISGKGILDHLMLAIIKGSIQMQAAPDVKCHIDMAPVDYVAAATAKLAMDKRAANGTYHVNNPNPCDPALVHEVAREYGYDFALLPVPEWLEVLLAREDLQENALHPYMQVLEQFGEESLELPRYDTTRATAALAGAGVACPPVSAELLRTYFDWWIDVGFFPPPVRRQAP